MKSVFFTLTSAFLLFISCSSPLDKKYNEATLAADSEELKKSLSDEERQLIATEIVRATFKGDSLNGKTYGEILMAAKDAKIQQAKEEEEAKALAEKAKLEQETRTKRLNDALTVTLYDKGYVEVDYQDYLTYKFAFENKTDKDIKAFKGSFAINDLFDKEIKSISLTYDKGVPARKVKNWDATTEYNQFMDEDITLKQKTMDALKLVWTPEKIIFSDGSTLE